MPLTPLDAENMRFPVVMRGYDRREVDEFRIRVAGALEEYINQLGALKARIGELETALARYRENEELLKNSVVLAQRTADELAHAAHQRADAIIAAARAEASAISQDLGRLNAEREQFEYAFYGLLYGFMRRLEQANPALRQAGGVPPEAGLESPFPGAPDLAVEPAPLEQAPAYRAPAAPRAPLLTEMLPGRLQAAGAAPGRSNPRDSDSLSFASALAQAGAASDYHLLGEPEAPAPQELPSGGDEAAAAEKQPESGAPVG